jgi:hypothetical protein
VLPLSGHGPETDLLQVREIEGLGPVKAAINTVPLGSMDGEAFNGALVNSRNIVLTIGLNPDWANYSMEELRRLVYAYFMPKLQSRLVFHSSDDFPTVEISGYVEDVVPNIFAKDVEVQVSIICPDPYFTAVEPTVIVGISNQPIEVDYKGSIEAGINLKATEDSPPSPSLVSVQIGDPALSYFRVVCGINSSWYFVMNSVPGQKYVQNVQNGTGIIYNLLYRMQAGSTWPTLKPGINDFNVITDGGVQEWQLTYSERFGGL